MRIALTSALMMVAAIAWAADEPSPAAKTEAAPEAVQESPAEQAPANEQATEQATEETAEQATTEATAEATAPKQDDKPFKVPAGYRSKRVNGQQVYCASNVVSGSRFGKEKCRTEAQLREIERAREAAATPPSQACSGTAVCGKN